MTSARELQVPIFEILHKYDGERVHDDIKLGRRRYKFLRLPRFLAMHMKRFAKNNFYVRTSLGIPDVCCSVSTSCCRAIWGGVAHMAGAVCAWSTTSSDHGPLCADCR